MAILKCKMCGGDLNLMEGASTAECEFCGSVQTVPKVDNEKKLTLFGRANRLRAACDFDKAAGIYEAIVADFPEEAEAYWGLVLCKYGIEYVDDPATGKKIPTCHRSGFDSVMKDPNVELAQEYADIMARRLYREEAKVIEELRKGIIEVSANEQPYDIFICYKETDFDGKRTLDSVLAMDIYEALTDKGYRVFFSRISLEDKLGTEYEPYIFAALNSAKIMLVIGTDYEYFNAVWVKNEWSRFLKLMAQDKSKHLIPCYKGIDAYDMPEEFARLQAQDLDKMGAIQDIVRGVQKLLPKQEQAAKEMVQQAASNAAPLLKRAFMFLEDGDWAKADDFCEQVLNQDPENAQAYLGKLMAELQVKKQDELKDQSEPFDSRNNYQKAIRFGDDRLKTALQGYVAYINYARTQRAEEAHIAQKQREEAERIARKKQKEAERIAAEKKRQTLLAIREKLQPAQLLLSAGCSHTVGLKADGTVLALGWNAEGQCNVADWKDVVAVSGGFDHTVGLKADGTVIATKHSGKRQYCGQCEVAGWRDIVAIAAGNAHTVGLKADGTLVAVGHNKYGQCNVADWKNIIAISAGRFHTIGLKADGTLVAVGHNNNDRCRIGRWENVVAIAAGNDHTVGLKADGTLVAVGHNNDGRCSVADWKNIIAISAGMSHTVGLKADGTVVAMGSNKYGQCNVADWKNIIAISAGMSHTVGLKADGTLVAVGSNYRDQCNVAGWKLFKNYDNLEQERVEMRQRREAGLCQHCGGQLKGLFTKKCVSCGKPKDY